MEKERDKAKCFRRLLYGVLFMCWTSLAFAQEASVSGFIKDKTDGYPLVDASVVLFRLPDSALVVEPTGTDLNGKFIFTSVPPGDYALKILYVGYKDFMKSLTVTTASLELGTLSLSQQGLDDQVIVTVLERSVVQKGDTTQFSADAYKTNPDANAEDLITKMPGVTVQDGKVQAQGENVTKVLVDGKPFFGDDPATVLKNLPADVIDKVQVFDQMSDQSQFTGFDDGNRSKTINIVTKADKRDGSFGKVYAGYGYNDVYKAGANVNIFNGDRRISILGQSNNINEQNFSTDDLLGVSSSSSQGGGNRGGGGGPPGGGGGQGGGNFGRPGGGSDNFLVSTQGGISKTHALGLNYSDKWGKKKKWDVSGSYFFNRSDNTSDTRVYRKYVLNSADSSQIYNQRTLATSVNVNHRFNARLDYKIDSSNSVLIVPKFSYQQNDGDRGLAAASDRASVPLNNTINTYNSKQYALNASSMVMYRHRFAKKGRTFSLNANGGVNATNGNNNFFAENTYYTNSSLSDTLNQHSDLVKNGYTIDGRASYTEPINLKSILEFTYNTSYTLSESDKRTYNYVAASQEYTAQDTALSNVFKSTYLTNAGGAGYRYQTEAIQVGVNVAYQVSTLNNNQDFPKETTLNKSFSNVLPSARVRFNFSKTKNLRADYRTQTTAPSVDQLQNVINNSNPLQLSTGNPNLKQQFQHNLFLRYSATNTLKSSTFFVMAGGSYTQDYVANSTYIANVDTTINGVDLAKGAQLSTKQNLDGYFSVRSFGSYGMPIKAIKSNLNINLFATYTRTPGLINNRVNYANSPSLGAGFVVSSNISPAVDFNVSTNSSYNFVKNTLSVNANAEYFSQNSKVKLNVIAKKHIVFTTEATHQYNAGLSAGFNQNYLLWNAGLGYKFLKNNAAELRLTVFDILGQNNSVSRTFTDIYNEDTRTNVLQRYYMLTFTYNFRNYKKAKTPDIE